jgi:uncharacterized protein involved in cysteine biosynthesis
MIIAFVNAFRDFSNKSYRNIAWKGLVGSLLIFILVWIVIWLALEPLESFLTGSFFGLYDWFSQKLTSFFSGLFIIIFAWFLFPPTVMLVISFFLEQTIDTVEKQHYPNLPAPHEQSILKNFLYTMRFTAISLSLNVLVIPIYIIFFFLGPLNLFVFYGLNGYLLGKEYFELITNRRLKPQDGIYLYKAAKGRVFIAGVIITFLMTIPIINLVAPVIATAAMVHLVQGWSKALDTINQ